MGNFFGTSHNAAYGRRIFPLMLALLACLMWVSAAHAQEAPFDSQYDPPPTTPDCGYDPSDPDDSGDSSGPGASGDPNSECDPAAPTDSEGPIVVLPTTGGFFLAPLLLGLTAVVGTGVLIVRKKGR